MSATNPLPRKRKLLHPDADASVEVKKPKLTESNTNTAPSKTPTKEATAKDEEVSNGDLRLQKKAMTKKIKQITSTKTGAAGSTPIVQPSNSSEEFPNGHLYCHQCNKKRDALRESYLPIYFQP